MSNPFTTPRTKRAPWAGNDGFCFEESEHIVHDDYADTARMS